MWRRWLLIIGIAGVLIAALWWTELAYNPVHPHAGNYHGYKADQEQNPGDDLARVIGVIFWAIINATESHHDAWLVLETFALAAFTFTLWRSTNRLWRTSQEHADHMEESVGVARKAANAAKGSADAAERTVETMERTAERQLRAYVHVADATILYANSEYRPNIRINKPFRSWS